LLRIGIDVGGTFTDVVAVDAATRAIVARVKVPTTHGAVDGVAAGIVEGIRRVLTEPDVDASAVAFIAHSTTQATNALLEGDVARVGIVGITGALDAALVRAHARFRPMELAPGATFAPAFAFARRDDPRASEAAVDALIAAACAAIAVSAPFGVDDTAAEDRVAAYARSRGVAATTGHDVAATYGLRARTRTAALNAAILPTMVRTASMTAGAASRAGIAAPLMIMRSDGGVMDVREVERRPILTMLSGPAAGIAGALLHERVTDGIFIEVGGTSADVSVIRRGLPQMRPARVGGHRTMLRTLDVRTLGIAGGSLLRIDPQRRGADAVLDVGPRSAHIAGLRYACFTPEDVVAVAEPQLVRPLASDPQDALALVAPDGVRIAVTTTCAANALGIVPDGAFARGDGAAARLAFARAGAAYGIDGTVLARALLDRAAAKVRACIEELVREYHLDSATIDLIGGGGGAAALVPHVASTLGVPYRIARDAEVISPAGVALALVRDSVERTIANPAPDDVVRVRRDAVERVVAAGADPTLVEVTMEIDPRRNLVRAIASGALAAAGAAAPEAAGADAVCAAAARALRAEAAGVREVARSAGFVAYAVRRARRVPPWLPIAPRHVWDDACIVDRSGVARAIARRAHLTTVQRGALAGALPRLLEDATSFGDVGRALPDCWIAYGTRVADLGGLSSAAQVVALAEEELRGIDPAAPVIVLLAERDA
jgi:N-methylhydantoinase A